MPQVSGSESSEGEGDPAGAEELSAILPLELIKIQVVPPAPNRGSSAIDWLHDFRGFSWIAYGAASLLVISHCPSPTSREEDQVGPFFKQVIEPPLHPPSPVGAASASAGDGSAAVNAVAWCHSLPSAGEVAAGLGSCVWVYSPDSSNARGSLYWRQIAVLLHSFTIEAIEWTQSGDGLVVAGDEVVSWKRKNLSWEMSWKSQVSVSQSLVSTTWSANGPVATVAHFSAYSHVAAVKKFSSQEASQRVVVFYRDEKSKIVDVELCHPKPVSMIQWRPYHVPISRKDFTHSRRDVLLTCCLDGAVRLWSEIDGGKVRKSSKDMSDQKRIRQSFHVIAVIEINQCLKGVIGTNIFMSWATEVLGTLSKGEDVEQSDQVGCCEWLVGIGPGLSISFWSIHCLDDVFPLRFPRVNLWKKKTLMDFGVENSSNLKISTSEGQPILIKALVWRNWLSGPPVACSLLQLLPDNSVSWSHIYSHAVTSEGGSLNEARTGEILSCFTGAFLNEDSHMGRILRVAVHPSSCEVEIAVSLDSNGFLLFWSFSTVIDCVSSIHMLADPVCQFIGKVSIEDMHNGVGCSALSWAPSVLSDDRFLLLGHAEGIDCMLIKISRHAGERILFHKVFTIPLSGYNQSDGPDYISATPLASTCKQPFIFNSFMLLAIWIKKFQVLAWKIVMHSDDHDRSASVCRCFSDDVHVSKSQGWKYEIYFDCRSYLVFVDLCSMEFPRSHDIRKVTSIAVPPPNKFYPSVQQMWISSKHIHRNSSLYHMVTGHFDGTVRLWRTPSLRTPDMPSDGRYLPWELVGMFIAHHGPVSGLALSGCASNIATFCKEDSSGISNVHIWQFVYLLGGGSFLLEDKVSLDGDIVALNWCALGNGPSILGVCLPNELLLYSPKGSCNLKLQKSGKAPDMQKWVCIARCYSYAIAQDIVWGPRLTPVLVHERHLSVFSQWSSRRDNNHHSKSSGPEFKKDYSSGACVSETYVDFPFAVCFNTGMCIAEGPLTNKDSEACELLQNSMGNVSDIDKSCELLYYQNHASGTKSRLYMIAEVADESFKLLPAYHPQALLLHLFSGNWKRAYSIVRHLVRCLNSNDFGGQNSCLPVPEISFSDYFGEIHTRASQNKGLQWGHDIGKGASTVQFQQNLFQLAEGHSLVNVSESWSNSTSQESETMGFINTLKKSDNVRAIADIDRTELLAIVDVLGEISDPKNGFAYESFDQPGRRFWVSVRFQHLHFLRKFGRSPSVEETVVDSSMIAWAFQSDCQDNLVSSLLSAEPSWIEMQNIGVGFWFTNATQLRSRMEKLARLQYLKRKDPKDCALLYIALNRLQVLSGLFKLSKEEKDKALVGFLARNFQEEKNKVAALKNAYVLMGKHQLELAIAFFLLGGDPFSAVTVCAKNLGDKQLALVICRLIHGDGGALEHQLISIFLLPNAIEKGDYWLASMLEVLLSVSLPSGHWRVTLIHSRDY
uniref:DmX-like protein 1 n=1 Tax=Anthurium amnicola TaxID=1678845 RepID=A0A1D1XGP0_9ARAE